MNESLPSRQRRNKERKKANQAGLCTAKPSFFFPLPLRRTKRTFSRPQPSCRSLGGGDLNFPISVAVGVVDEETLEKKQKKKKKRGLRAVAVPPHDDDDDDDGGGGGLRLSLRVHACSKLKPGAVLAMCDAGHPSDPRPSRHEEKDTSLGKTLGNSELCPPTTVWRREGERTWLLGGGMEMFRGLLLHVVLLYCSTALYGGPTETIPLCLHHTAKPCQRGEEEKKPASTRRGRGRALVRA